MANPLTAQAPRHANDRNPERRLRIAYVSGEFREHVVGRYIRPIIEAHAREQFEVFCYSDSPGEDAVGQKIRAAAAQWRRTHGFSHEKLAQLIRDDRIDILIDSSNHTGTNRLLAFARKPAPIQL